MLTKDPYTRATDPRCIHNMAGRSQNSWLRSARHGHWLSTRSLRTDASCTANRDRCFIRDQIRRVRRLAHSKAGRTTIGLNPRHSCKFKNYVRDIHSHFLLYYTCNKKSQRSIKLLSPENVSHHLLYLS